MSWGNGSWSAEQRAEFARDPEGARKKIKRAQRLVRHWAKRGKSNARMNRAYNAAAYLQQRAERPGAKYEYHGVGHDKGRSTPIVQDKETKRRVSFTQKLDRRLVGKHIPNKGKRMKRELKEETIAMFLLEAKMKGPPEWYDDDDGPIEKGKEKLRQWTGMGHGKETSDWEEKPPKRSRQAQMGGTKAGAPPAKFTPDTSYVHGRTEKAGRIAKFFGGKDRWVQTTKKG